jgi:Tfp pilus assembly protein PilN
VIEINLLPAERASRPARHHSVGLTRLTRAPTPRGEPWTAGLGAAGFLVLLFAGGSWWSTSSTIAGLHGDVAREVEDSTRYAAAIALLGAARARQDTIHRKIEVIREADADRYLWPRLLDEISSAVSPSTWLTRMSSTEAADGHGPVIVIEGASASTQLLTLFMKNLEGSPLLREVTLVTTEQVTGEGYTFNRFTLEARFEASAASLLASTPVTEPSR